MADATLVKLGEIAERQWGLVTTAQADNAGVSRKQLSRMASSGAVERIAQGVYRVAGAPPQRHEAIYATWLALGGATSPRTPPGVAPVVAAGQTAAVVHAIGDFLLDGLDFIVPSRKGTRIPDVRLRIRDLTRPEVIPVEGLPTLTVERTIAVRSDKLTAPNALITYLSPVAQRHRSDGRTLANHLFDLAGVTPEGWKT
jgi:hypothetical protein